jgi:hypothetical protein
MKSPASLGCENRASYSVQQPEHTPRSLAEQQISQRFGLSPVHAAIIVSLAGLGPREVRT